MTKTNFIFKSNQELNEMVMQYQSNPSDQLYMDIHEAVYPMAEAVSLKYYHQSKGLNKGKDEFVQCARLAIFKAVDKYDVNRGSDFTSLVKQLVGWTLNDELFKKSKNKANVFNASVLSLDKPLSSNEGTFYDAVEYQIATDPNEVFNAVMPEQTQDTDSLVDVLTGLVKEFSVTATEDDSTIIKIWVATILTISDLKADTKKLVNKALESAMPAITPATIRQKKGRAEKRFNTFAQKKGYPSFALSHF